jgi:hypothetical protein
MEPRSRAVADRHARRGLGGPGIAEHQDQFPRFDGACLKWEYFGSPHQRFGLLATGTIDADAYILFFGVEYVECPTEMQHVRLRLATDAEVERIHPRLVHDYSSPQLDWCDYLAIEHEDGVGYVVATMMFTPWRSVPSEHF